MHLTIPLWSGTNDNRRFIISRGRLVKAPEYRRWMEEAVREVKHQMTAIQAHPTYEHPLTYRVIIHLPDKRSDAENYSKGIRDVLTEAGAWSDDKFALPHLVAVFVDRDEPPRAEISWED